MHLSTLHKCVETIPLIFVYSPAQELSLVVLHEVVRERDVARLAYRTRAGGDSARYRQTVFLDAFQPSRELGSTDGGAIPPAPEVPTSTKMSARLRCAGNTVHPRTCEALHKGATQVRTAAGVVFSPAPLSLTHVRPSALKPPG